MNINEFLEKIKAQFYLMKELEKLEYEKAKIDTQIAEKEGFIGATNREIANSAKPTPFPFTMELDRELYLVNIISGNIEIDFEKIKFFKP